MTAQALRLLIGFARPYRWAIPILIVLGVLASIAEGLGIGLLIPVLGSMLDSTATDAVGPYARVMASLVSDGEPAKQLMVLALVMAALIALKTLVLVANVRLASVINGRITHDLRTGICHQLLRVDYGFFSNADSGRLMNLVDVQTHRTSEAIMHAVNILISASFLFVFTTLLLLISWQLTLIGIVVALPVSIFVRSRTKRAQIVGDEMLNRNASLTGRMMELLGAMRTVRIFGQDRAEEDKFASLADQAKETFVRAETLTWTVEPLVEMFYLPLFLATLGYAWFAEIGVPSLLAFLVLLYRMQPQLKRIDYARVDLSRFAPGMQELANLLREDDKQYIQSGDVVLDRIRTGIEFDSVSFSYDGAKKPALQDVSFRIPCRSVFALVGRSGAGKSTVLNLLFRLYDPSIGTVRIDGVALQDFDLSSIREVMSFSGQDADLMTGSIRDNIAYGTPGATSECIYTAARDAHAESFILEKPNGYDEQVGERGRRLSGGQRQRIALARALARHPQVLVLDEATNAVDMLTQLAIQETIDQLAGTCTVIVVAHRLSTVLRADHVLVMSDGRVIEEGAPDEVIDVGGEFSKLYELE